MSEAQLTQAPSCLQNLFKHLIEAETLTFQTAEARKNVKAAFVWNLQTFRCIQISFSPPTHGHFVLSKMSFAATLSNSWV